MKIYEKCPRCSSDDIDKTPILPDGMYYWCNSCGWDLTQVRRYVAFPELIPMVDTGYDSESEIVDHLAELLNMDLDGVFLEAGSFSYYKVELPNGKRLRIQIDSRSDDEDLTFISKITVENPQSSGRREFKYI